MPISAKKSYKLQFFSLQVYAKSQKKFHQGKEKMVLACPKTSFSTGQVYLIILEVKNEQ